MKDITTKIKPYNMPTNKTALEMLIEKLENRINSMPEYAKNHDMACKGIIAGVYESIKDAKSLLPTERTQIEEAVSKGQNSVKLEKDFGYCRTVITMTASHYFETTYKK